MSKKPRSVSARILPSDTRDAERTDRPWPLLLFVLAIACGIIAVAMSVHPGDGRKPAAQDRQATTAAVAPHRTSRGGTAKPAEKDTSRRPKAAQVSTKIAVGTPYERPLQTTGHRRALVRKSLTAIAGMQQKTVGRSGKPSAELTKLAAQLRSQDKQLARQQAHLIAAARSWKATRAAERTAPARRPTMPRITLAAEHTATKTTKKMKETKASAGQAKATAVADTVAAFSGDADTTGLSAYLAACIAEPSKCGTTAPSAATATPADTAPSQPQICIQGGSGTGQSVTSEGQNSYPAIACGDCHRLHPLGSDDGTATGSASREDGTSDAAAQVCPPVSDTGGSSPNTSSRRSPTPTGGQDAGAYTGTQDGRDGDAQGGQYVGADDGDRPEHHRGHHHDGDRSHDHDARQDHDGSHDHDGRRNDDARSYGRDRSSDTTQGTTRENAGASDRSDRVSVCPDTTRGSYRPCSPCSSAQHLTQGRKMIPLCLTTGMTQSSDGSASAGRDATASYTAQDTTGATGSYAIGMNAEESPNGFSSGPVGSDSAQAITRPAMGGAQPYDAQTVR
ncbi:hypothetical protein [Actinoallomurus sp. NPDC050550]|uniref:hypothetical protein n=1 Tax=Actinoallomurus sp. NPDC050550 TaxID=3154937 RepID=UPI0033FA3949